MAEKTWIIDSEFNATTHTKSSQELSSRRREVNAPRLEHLAVWAEDINETLEFLQNTLSWRRHPIEFGVGKDNEVFGGTDLAFVDATGFWLERVQPTSEGPGMEFLKEKGMEAWCSLILIKISRQ
ncbi:MAG: hypothetical protein ACJAYC_002416 [Halieaceae bacterium]|jgi:hypothetical protein